MASKFDGITENSKFKAGPTEILAKRSIMVAAASLDPLGVSPTGVIPKGTPMGAIPASGFYKPIRRTIADHACTTGEKEIGCIETTMFAVGDVVTVVPAATPTVAASALGTIDTIQAGVGITLVGNSTTAVTAGDIIQVAENDRQTDACILIEDVDLRNGEGTAVDTPAVGMTMGQIAKAVLNFNCATAKGISITRLAFEIPLVDFVNAVAGVVE